MYGLEVCGGQDTLGSCVTFHKGEWGKSRFLAEKRMAHSSWATHGGVVLMGGLDSPTTTETIKGGKEKGEPGFTLNYRTQ